MPQPEGRTLNIDVYLTTLALGIMPGIQDLQGWRVFSSISMDARTMKYLEWDNFSDWNRPEGKELANAEPPPTAGFGKPTEQLVRARKWGVHTFWTDDDLAEAEVGPSTAQVYERRKVAYVTRMAMLRKELDVVALIRNSSWATKLQGTNAADPAGSTAGAGGDITGSFLQWDDDDAEPIKLLRKIARSMQLRTGQRPNIGVFPGTVLDVLYEHPTFLDRVTGGATTERPAAVNKALLAQMLGLDEIIEVSSVYNTAKEGQAANVSWMWGFDVWLGYRPSGDDIDPEKPAPAYWFNWTGRNGVRPSPFNQAANNEGIFINRFNSQRPAGYNAEAYLFAAPRLVAPKLGVLLKDVISGFTPL